jgi:hypothetical protein
MQQHLEGDIADINVVDRLVDLWRNQFTGAIRFENDGVIKILYFKGGDVLSASTNDRADSVDEILMRAGKVSREHVKQALAKRKENETLGDALLNLGFITRKELTWGRRVQAVGVIRSISEWKGGSYTVVADYLPKREEGTIFPLPQLIVELTVTDQEKQKYEKLLDGGSAVFEKSPAFGDTFPRLGLNEDADAIAAQIDGQRSATEIAAASRQDAFNTFKLLHAFTSLGLLHRAGQPNMPVPSVGANEPSFESDGVADASDAWGAPSPKFTFDDEPAPIPGLAPLDMEPLPPLPDPPAVATPRAQPEWAMPAPEAAMSGWDATPDVAPIPSAVATPAMPIETEETPQWGFDEAQIEASRSATKATREPNPYRIQKKPRSYGLLIGTMVVFILAGMAYFGYSWWNAQQSAAPSLTPVSNAPQTTTAVPAPQPVTNTVAEPLTRRRGEAEDSGARPPGAAADPGTIVESPGTTSTATARVPTPSPAAAKKPSPSSDLRERYDSMARTFAQDRTGTHAVQIAIVCEPSNVEKALRSGGSEIWFLPMSFRGRGCYRVFFGRFDNEAEAQRALSRVPQDLRESTPAVVRIPR